MKAEHFVDDAYVGSNELLFVKRRPASFRRFYSCGELRRSGFGAAVEDSIARQPLVWLNVVCLDAPIVACVWQWLFAKNFGLRLSLASQCALFFTAWLIYLIDRFADSISLPGRFEKTLREKFCLRHIRMWIVITILVGLADALFVLWRLDHQTVVAGMFLGTILILYLGVNFRFSRIWSTIPIKEIAVGFLFAAGTLGSLLPSLSLTETAAQKSVPGSVGLLFACLCSLNCMSIAVWERDLDRLHEKHSIATRLPYAKPLVRALALILAMSSFLFGALMPRFFSLALCLALSAGALVALDLVCVTRDERTALADLVLLTPIILLLFG